MAEHLKSACLLFPAVSTKPGVKGVRVRVHPTLVSRSGNCRRRLSSLGHHPFRFIRLSLELKMVLENNKASLVTHCGSRPRRTLLFYGDRKSSRRSIKLSVVSAVPCGHLRAAVPRPPLPQWKRVRQPSDGSGSICGKAGHRGTLTAVSCYDHSANCGRPSLPFLTTNPEMC